MADATGLYAEAPEHAALAALVAEPRPALVFDRTGCFLRWVNAAGAALLGLRTVAAAVDWRLPSNHPLARRVGTLYEILPAGQERVERLALPTGPLPRPVITRARRLAIDATKTVLLVVVDGAPAVGDDPVAAYARFAGLMTSPSPQPIAAAPAAATAEPEIAEPEVVPAAPIAAVETAATESRPEPEAVVAPAVETTAEAEPTAAEEAAPANEAAVPTDNAPLAAAVTDAIAAPTSDAPSAFRFPDHGRTVRFVFELAADFSVRFLSDELAQTVGAPTADVVGRRWNEVAERFDLDPRRRVAQALERHDTFTGLTVDWPISGHALRVPVDLAGMPVLGRDRSFSGYRGFGVIKTGAAFPAEMLALPAFEPIVTAMPEPMETPSAPVAVEPEPAAAAPIAAALAAIDTADLAGEAIAAPEPIDARAEADATDAAEVGAVEAEAVEIETVEAEAVEIETVEAGAVEAIAEVELPAAPIEAVEAEPAEAVASEMAEDEAVEDEDAAVPTTAEIIASPIIPRPIPQDDARAALSKPERDAFDKIAAALTEAFGGRLAEPAAPPAEPPLVETAEPAPQPAPTGPKSLDVALIDKLPVAIAILRTGDIIHVNRAFLDLAGYADLDEINASGGLAGVFEGSALPRDASIPAIRRKDGVEVPVSAKLHAMEFDGGFASLLVVQETAATTSRDRLAAAEQRVEDLEAILDTATDGVLVLDQRGIVIGANRSAEALFGVERAEMIGARLIDHLAPESHRAALDYLDGLTRNGLSSVLNDGREVIGRVEGGGLVPLFMTIGRVSLTKYCAVLRDITQWKRAEEELTAAKRSAETASSQKSDFLAKMSHEIRTPLNAIIGFSEVMMEERFGPVANDRYKEYLRDIHVSGAHIMSLVNDLLDLSKIEAGKLELNFEAVGLNEVVRECAALMQPQANRERIIIRTSLSSSLPPVVADSRSLRQIVLNLLSNAVKFNTSGGQVIVSTLYEDTGEVVLRVRDTGHGMSDSDVVKALEPFRQLATTRTGQGTGLGLPLTKALVEANRAAFRIESTPGQGTLIQITFPSTRVLAE